MTGYANWQFYTTEYLHGDIPTLTEKNFPRWISAASRYIAFVVKFSGVDIADHAHAVSIAACELAEFLYDNRNKAKASGTKVIPKGLSISRGKESDPQSIEAQKYAIVAEHLTGTGLLSRVVG